MNPTIVNDSILALIAEKAETPVAELASDATLEDLGLDSLHLMEIAMWVDERYGVNIPEGALRQDQTLTEAVEYLADQIGRP